MYYILEFENINSKETAQTMFDLAGIPNGTIISSGSIIRVNILPKHKWIIYFTEETIKNNSSFEKDCNKVKNIMPGVKSFTPLTTITKTPCDSDWVWEDDYIDNVFSSICV